jgi:hypothetical protein
MGRSFGFIAVLIVVAIGAYFYMGQVQSITPAGSSPNAAIDTVAVRNDLLALANAERRYWATNAKYAGLDDLRKGGDIHIPTRPNYSYTAEATDTTFRVTATYSGQDPKAPKHLSVDESMALSSY